MCSLTHRKKNRIEFTKKNECNQLNAFDIFSRRYFICYFPTIFTHYGHQKRIIINENNYESFL